MKRPAFLANTKHQSGVDAIPLLNDFRSLPIAEAVEVDKWLMWASQQGSMTHPERYLYNWINESDEAVDFFDGAA